MLKKQTNQRGSILLESLISVLIIAFSLLGLAKTMTFGIKNSTDSGMSNRALMLAYSMSDSIRAKPSAAKSGDFNNLSGNNTQSDFSAWNQDLARQMPDGKGYVCRGSFSGGVCTENKSSAIFVVRVTWADKGARNSVELPFYPVNN